MGCRPTWDHATGRVTGIEVLPPAAIGRPRVDVTWRISGLFRDLFPAQIALLDAAVRAVAAREETDDENPLAGAWRNAGESPAVLARIFGTAPGAYGAGIGDHRPRARSRRDRRGLSRRSVSCLWRRRRRRDGAAAANSRRGSRAPICWFIRATIPAAISWRARRTPPSSAASRRRQQTLGRTPDLIMLDVTDPQPSARASARPGAGAHRARPRHQSALHRRARCATARAAPPSLPRPSTG